MQVKKKGGWKSEGKQIDASVAHGVNSLHVMVPFGVQVEDVGSLYFETKRHSNERERKRERERESDGGRRAHSVLIEGEMGTQYFDVQAARTLMLSSD